MSVKVVIGNREYFKGIEKIAYEGPDSKNPLDFKTKLLTWEQYYYTRFRKQPCET